MLRPRRPETSLLELDGVFRALAGSRFRRSFTLGAKERAYLRDRGMPTVIEHALDPTLAQLVQLDSAVRSMRGRMTRTLHPDLTIWPLSP